MDDLWKKRNLLRGGTLRLAVLERSCKRKRQSKKRGGKAGKAGRDILWRERLKRKK